MEQLKVKIAGEIALSSDPGNAMKKWREIFSVSQSDLSHYLGISPSTISDYESNRRKSPGIGVIRRFVDALFEIDIKNGGELIKRFKEAEPEQKFFDAIDFPKSVPARTLMETLEAQTLACDRKLNEMPLYGLTLLDSIKIILELPYESFVKIYSSTSQRALLFTGASTGRSPMVAVRLSPIKPAVVILHQISADKVDKLAIKIAESEGIPLLVTNLSAQDVKKRLEKFA
ncbi:MAG TPA: helix-turn-helix domain-containing protein [Candidatus Norongarragalinales archaeon]|nr:helix-turn-helix domain-containing protein [Candidatus Norongarragalinales archaeon]